MYKVVELLSKCASSIPKISLRRKYDRDILLYAIFFSGYNLGTSWKCNQLMFWFFSLRRMESPVSFHTSAKEGPMRYANGFLKT